MRLSQSLSISLRRNSHYFISKPFISGQTSSFLPGTPIFQCSSFSYLCLARFQAQRNLKSIQTRNFSTDPDFYENWLKDNPSPPPQEVVIKTIRDELLDSADDYVKELAEQVLSLSGKETVQLLGIYSVKMGLNPNHVYNSILFGAGGGGGGGGGGGRQVAAPAGGAAPEPVEEKKEAKKEEAPTPPALVKLQLKAVGDSKFKVLKEIRALRPELQLIETKGLVDTLPSTLREGLAREEGETWLKKFKEAGADVELI